MAEAATVIKKELNEKPHWTVQLKLPARPLSLGCAKDLHSAGLPDIQRDLVLALTASLPSLAHRDSYYGAAPCPKLGSRTYPRTWQIDAFNPCGHRLLVNIAYSGKPEAVKASLRRRARSMSLRALR